MRCLRDDQGSITPYALIFIVILTMFIGLAVDGGAKLRAGWEAVGVAEQAARAGAGQIDRSAAYAGKRLVVDRGAATRAAQSYLSATGHRGNVSVTGPRTLQVRVTVTKPTWMLSVVGISSVTQTAAATADLATGVEGEQR
ncbi:Tad domain-containing protein [Spirillospora sp. NPDC052269]